MKYKIGDKVRIKKNYMGPLNAMIKLKELNTNRVVTIKKVCDYFYYMEEIKWGWRDEEIECLVSVKDYKEPEPITSRFEILDIR